MRDGERGLWMEARASIAEATPPVEYLPRKGAGYARSAQGIPLGIASTELQGEYPIALLGEGPIEGPRYDLASFPLDADIASSLSTRSSGAGCHVQ